MGFRSATWMQLGCAALALALACAAPWQGILVGSCEGCEAVFEYGGQELAPTATLPDWERDGPRLELRGTIYEPDGTTPAAGAILYVYHTNQQGVYETHGDETGWARRHGIIRGWIRTDETGRYTVRTLLPATYPDRSQAAHIHGTILEPDGRYYWIDEWRFRGDSLLDEDDASPGDAQGGSGMVELERDGDVQVARRDIVLGRNVPGYGSDQSGTLSISRTPSMTTAARRRPSQSST